MFRFSFRVILASIGLTLLSSCAGISYFGVGAAPRPAPGTRVNWPGVAFTEVRGFCYDYTAADHSEFLKDGVMHPGVLDANGVRLTPAQVSQLMDAITISQDKQSRTPCYKPHHAFVFYNAQGQTVAMFEMCFGCNQFESMPGGVPEYINYNALYQLCADLGLPLGEGNDFYTAACRRH